MTPEGITRKLTAILSADVKDYTRLMSQDDVGTIRTLTAYKEGMETLIRRYRGQVVDATGDNVLARFDSVLDAVNCAAEMQRELAERNAELPDHRKMEFRMGVSLGDVVEEEGRIFGDGVNIAARLQALAEARNPGWHPAARHNPPHSTGGSDCRARSFRRARGRSGSG